MKIPLPCQVRAVLFSVIWLVEHSSAAICGGVERLWVDAGAGGDGRPYLCSTPSQHTAPSVERCASMEDERGKARRAARGGRKAAGPLHGAGSQGSPSPSLFLSLSSCLFLFITLALFLRVSLFLLSPLSSPQPRLTLRSIGAAGGSGRCRRAAAAAEAGPLRSARGEPAAAPTRQMEAGSQSPGHSAPGSWRRVRRGRRTPVTWLRRAVRRGAAGAGARGFGCKAAERVTRGAVWIGWSVDCVGCEARLDHARLVIPAAASLQRAGHDSDRR